MEMILLLPWCLSFISTKNNMSKTLLTLLTSVILAFTNHLALAGSATWELHPHNMPLWQDADNWNPATVPNGPNDIATFGVSIGDEISISATVEVNQIVFIPGASSFGISADQGNLTIS